MSALRCSELCRRGALTRGSFAWPACDQHCAVLFLLQGPAPATSVEGLSAEPQTSTAWSTPVSATLSFRHLAQLQAGHRLAARWLRLLRTRKAGGAKRRRASRLKACHAWIRKKLRCSWATILPLPLAWARARPWQPGRCVPLRKHASLSCLPTLPRQSAAGPSSAPFAGRLVASARHQLSEGHASVGAWRGLRPCPFLPFLAGDWQGGATETARPCGALSSSSTSWPVIKIKGPLERLFTIYVTASAQHLAFFWRTPVELSRRRFASGASSSLSSNALPHGISICIRLKLAPAASPPACSVSRAWFLPFLTSGRQSDPTPTGTAARRPVLLFVLLACHYRPLENTLCITASASPSSRASLGS